MKKRLINKLLSYLLNAVNPDNVVKADKGKIYIGGKPVSDSEVKMLEAEVKALEGFRIWSLMNETVRSQAMEKGFNNSLTYEDLLTSKLMLYNLDIINSIVRVFREKK